MSGTANEYEIETTAGREYAKQMAERKFGDDVKILRSPVDKKQVYDLFRGDEIIGELWIEHYVHDDKDRRGILDGKLMETPPDQQDALLRSVSDKYRTGVSGTFNMLDD